jgi:inorganic pyrophosphatase/exopolyphosphatase
MLIKGMVSADGNTYRVSRVSDGVYEVVRIIDDHRIGTFETSPTLRVMPEGVDSTLLREIAYLAMKQGKISSVRPAPFL